jgi:hypothetical protein
MTDSHLSNTVNREIFALGEFALGEVGEFAFSVI